MDWNTLISVIVGGTIGTVGSVVTPALSSWLNDKSERKKQRTEKLGELIEIVYATDHWLSERRRTAIFGAEIVQGPNPIPKAIAITALYFPKFNDLLAQYDLEVSKFELWMISTGQKRMADNKANLIEGFDEAYQPYLDKRTNVIIELKNFAKKEFGE